jgi:leucyl aminopeptidase
MHSYQGVLEKSVGFELPEILRKEIKCTISDIKNLATDNNIGNLTAGLFLSYFVDQTVSSFICINMYIFYKIE